uniref:Uncharacterized protein n=1 Tax=Hyaloperonospora arabidopsidis (strain Emoy2) TaxID=559515 RepID=M4BMR5_HYAAE
MEGVVVITLLCSVEGDTTSDGETRKLEELRQSVSIATTPELIWHFSGLDYTGYIEDSLLGTTTTCSLCVLQDLGSSQSLNVLEDFVHKQLASDIVDTSMFWNGDSSNDTTLASAASVAAYVS